MNFRILIIAAVLIFGMAGVAFASGQILDAGNDDSDMLAGDGMQESPGSNTGQSYLSHDPDDESGDDAAGDQYGENDDIDDDDVDDMDDDADESTDDSDEADDMDDDDDMSSGLERSSSHQSQTEMYEPDEAEDDMEHSGPGSMTNANSSGAGNGAASSNTREGMDDD